VIGLICNKGDAAIAKCHLEGIIRLFPQSKISILSGRPNDEKEFFSKYAADVHGYLFSTYGRKLPKFLLSVEFIFKTVMYLIWIKFKQFPIDNNGKTILSLYKKSDVIIYSGGGYLGGPYRSIADVLIPIFIARKLGKKIYLSGVTIESPRRFFLKTLMRFALNRVDLITTRDPLSLNVLKSLRIKTPSYLTSDYAFLLESEPIDLGYHLLRVAGIPKNDKVRIGISLKDWNSELKASFKSEVPSRKIVPYRNAVIEAINIILTKLDAIIVIFPFEVSPKYDDLAIARSTKNSISKSLADRVFILTEDYQPEQMKAMIGTMDIFIGTRFHSIVFALSMYVPTISIGYMQKNRGLMEMMGLKDWLLDFSTLTTDKLVDMTLKLLKERNEVITVIKSKLPNFQKDAMQNIRFIDELLQW